MKKTKYDSSKYEVSEEMPERFAQVIPGLGIQHFSKEHLTDSDMKALLKAKNQYVKKVKGKEEEIKEDAPRYTDTGAGTYPG
jgi:hypothetical protein